MNATNQPHMDRTALRAHLVQRCDTLADEMEAACGVDDDKLTGLYARIDALHMEIVELDAAMEAGVMI